MYLEKINKAKLPQHIAIIMDGNGRWAKKLGKLRVFGHQNGVKAVKDTVEAAAAIGLKYLTLYAFSTENWNRPKAEVDALMEILVSSIRKETTTLTKNNIRLLAIGNIESLPTNCQKELKEAMDLTKSNTGLSLILALSYSSKWEIINAVKNIVKVAKENKLESADINDEMFSDYLTTKGIQDPELIIRTSGEHRISNFLLWQIAYSEFYFIDLLWPDFRKEDLYKAIVEFQQRERRFGLTSEQLEN